MKLKEVHDFVANVYNICQKKVQYAEENKLPPETVEYERGRLYEAGYILEGIDGIIYKDEV